MASVDKDCLFCKIVSGDLPTKYLYEDENIIAFRDINPQAPTHILVIPKDHIAYAADINETHSDLIFSMINRANKLASEENIASDGYRLVINNGKGAGQTVFHLHLHLLGGRPMLWPPG